MGKLQSIFYEWDNQFFDLEYDLGTDISVLLENNDLKRFTNKETEDSEFVGVNGIPDIIKLDNNKVNSIWFSSRLDFPKNNSLFELPIEKLIPILNKRLKPLNSQVRHIKDMKSYDESDVLCLIFRDFFITQIGILKRKK